MLPQLFHGMYGLVRSQVASSCSGRRTI